MRNGIYTFYEGRYHLEIKTIRDNDLQATLNFTGNDCNLAEFIKDPNSQNSYYRIIEIQNLDNAYKVETLGLYKGFTVSVFSLEQADMLRINSSDKNSLELGLIDMHNGLYSNDIKKDELDKCWEIRSPALDLKMPPIKKKEVLFANR